MRNESPAVLGRGSERCGFCIEMRERGAPHPDGGSIAEAYAAPSTLPRRLLVEFAASLLQQFKDRHGRMALLEFTDDQLKDIGLSRSQACGGYSRYR